MIMYLRTSRPAADRSIRQRSTPSRSAPRSTPRSAPRSTPRSTPRSARVHGVVGWQGRTGENVGREMSKGKHKLTRARFARNRFYIFTTSFANSFHKYPEFFEVDQRAVFSTNNLDLDNNYQGVVEERRGRGSTRMGIGDPYKLHAHLRPSRHGS